MPGPLPIGDFVLYAEQSLALGLENRVLGGDVGVRSRAKESAGGQLVAGGGSVIDPDHEVISPSVSLGHRVVCGPVLTDAFVDHAIHLRSELPFPASTMPPLPLASAPTLGAPAVTVAAGHVAALVSGSYDTLTVDGSIVLNPGDYVFSSITIGHAGNLVSVGPVHIMVINYLTAGRLARLHPMFDQLADQLTISVAGTDQTVTLPAVSFGERAHLRALLDAPHGTVAFADRVTVKGAVAGFAIATGEHVDVRYESGFPQESGHQKGSQQLTGAYGVPPGPDADPVAGPVPPDTGISLAIGLPVRNGAELQTLIHNVSDPKNAQYRQYISQDTFNATYGATASDYQSLQDWATASGFITIATFPNNLLLRVTGTAAQVQQALFVNLFYRARPDGSLFIATDRDLSLDLSVAVLEINGLGDAVLPVSLSGTGSGGTYSAADLRNAYLGPGSPLQVLSGSGQNVGVVGFVNYVESDVTGYFNNQVPAQGQASPLPAPNVTVVETESAPIFTPSPPALSAEESTADVELVYAMAPEATILFFQGTTGITDRLDSILMGMATYKPALTVASCSLTFGKSDTSQQALDQMAAQGVSFFTGSGDSGDLSSVPDSTKMNHQTLVGGTILSTNQLAWAAEATWPGSGGGVISDVAIPDYQVGIIQISASTNGGSNTNRNYPDVAMLALNAEIFYGGTLANWNGTSVAAPLWAGFTALVNQMSLANNAGIMGWINPTLYDIGLTIGDTGNADLYSQCFHDINDNVSNKFFPWPVGGPGFQSVTGYDLVTGLGTPKGGLIYQLGNTTPLTPIEFTEIRFIIGTGGDDLRNDSTATADVFLKNGGQFTLTVKANGAGDWGNGTINGPIDFAIPNTVTLPTLSEGLSGVRINLIQGGSFPETDDNWDISFLQVSIFNPGSEQICQLNLVGGGSSGLVRLTGSGPSSPIYSTDLPGSGC